MKSDNYRFTSKISSTRKCSITSSQGTYLIARMPNGDHSLLIIHKHMGKLEITTQKVDILTELSYLVISLTNKSDSLSFHTM